MEQPRLFVDGKCFFPALLGAVEKAETSIFINMFIWRDDDIGNTLARALLAAMDRGVKVEISKDRYGVVLELAEEDQSSFFHKHPTVTEKIKANALRLFYRHGKGLPKKTRDEALYTRFVQHENLSLSASRFKADHSKYYVIDEKILFLGGINVEDKENGIDREGRAYRDYMLGIYGEERIRDFFRGLECTPDTSRDIYYGYNDNTDKSRFFMEKLYLDMIDAAREELHITMAYFSPCKKFIRSILAAAKRGVRVHILIPARANFQTDTNLKTARILLKKGGGNITVYLSPKMVHAKLVMNESTISLGSTNITKKAFSQLSELNVFIKNDSAPTARDVRASLEENYAEAKVIKDAEGISYHSIKAFIEGFLV